MGATLVYLEKPEKTKHAEVGKNEKLEYAAVSM